ncbi:MAG: transcriptional repressor [Deltaproteobacteria bacterium]|nr:transcriptional repressor [Deltaproteobacteria bacterium]MBI3016921.1 transcriptional repressor [Deltaproteobacteria bacterium]
MDLKTLLSTKGLKSTKQRDVIIQEFLKLKEHVNIDALYQKVKAKHPTIGYATVYRTMKLLKECGMASERHFGTRQALYEPHHETAHHDHLICVKCNKIIEFENEKIEKLQDVIAKKYGFRLESHKHELYGTCSQCKK